MKIFLSYASEDRAVAEELQLALAGAGHDVFFDRQSLPAGGDYHRRIKAAVDASQCFVFLISPDSVDAGGYALTEMGYARARWPHPKGHVLPVMVRPTPFPGIPAYLKSVTLLEPVGNLSAEAVDALNALDGDDTPATAVPRPRLLALGSVAVALLLGAGAAWWYVGTRPGPVAPAADSRPDPPLPNPLQLRFSYRSAQHRQVSQDDTLRVNLQTRQRVVDGERLAQQSGGYYSYNVAYPAAGEQLLGTLIREIRDSTLADAPQPARFCLKRPDKLQQSADQYVHLDCGENGSCARHFPSPTWLDVCPAALSRAALPFGLIAEAQAADTTRRWVVPSARTLQAHADQLKGVGYTFFDIDTDAFADPATIGIEVDIRVNGVPILEDALSAAQRPVPHPGGGSFHYRFALQSLDFEGAQAGCEAIHLSLRPRLAGARNGDALAITLPYVALRDQARQTLPFGKGSLSWSAHYVIPGDEWSHEAFFASVVFSPKDGESAAARARAQAVALKRAFDALRLRYQGRPVVAVIRPPLTLSGERLSFGLAAGVVQPSGQLRFTFAPQEADALAATMLAARSGNRDAQRVIDPQKYLYRVAGTAQRRDTATPEGTCRHVAGG